MYALFVIFSPILASLPSFRSVFQLFFFIKISFRSVDTSTFCFDACDVFVFTDLSIALASTQAKLMVIIQLCQRNSNRLEESGREVSPLCKIFAPITEDVSMNWDYTPVHLIESVENCWLCMRQCLKSSTYSHVIHCALAITQAIGNNASVKHWIMCNCKLQSLPLSCAGYNFYWLDEVNRSIAVPASRCNNCTGYTYLSQFSCTPHMLQPI